MSRLLELMHANKYEEFKRACRECTSAELEEEVAASGDNILMQALHYHDPRYFQALLAYDNFACSQSVLEWATKSDKRTILHDAIEEIRVKKTAKVEWILDHPRFNIEYLNKRNSAGYSPIELVIICNHIDALVKIIWHPQCTKDILQFLVKNAIIHDRVDALKAIVTNPRQLSEDIFSFADTRTALHAAVEKAVKNKKGGNTKIINLIVQSPKFNSNLLSVKNGEGKTALDLSIEAGNAEVLKTILESPRCTVDFIKAERLIIKAKMTRNEEVIDLVKKHEGRESYKRIYQSVKNNGDDLQKAYKLLQDYSTPWRYARFHWNRHHTDDVRQILKEFDDGAFDCIGALLVRLRELQETLPNQTGSLARRIEFIKKEFAHNEIEIQEQMERRFKTY